MVGGDDKLSNYLSKVETNLQQMKILGYDYALNLVIAQCQFITVVSIRWNFER